MKQLLLQLLLLIFYKNEIFIHTQDINQEYNLRSLKPTPIFNSSSKDSNSLKFHSKLLQTVYSDSYSKNYYYTTIYIGSQKVKQTYLIDTGSSLMSSPCKPCSECGAKKTNYYYSPLKKYKTLKCGSKICKMLQATNCIYKEDKEENKKLCSYNVKENNGDGLKGYFLNEIVYLEADKNEDYSHTKRKLFRSYALPLGCTTAEYGKYKELTTDGIMGINYNDKSFINLLYKLKIINQNVFSLCFSLRGGYMSLGEIDKTYHKSKKINYVPLLSSEVSYLINVNGIIIGDNKESINNKNIIASIDTGNTISYFPSSIYKLLIKNFKKYCKNKDGKCGNFENDPDLGFCAAFENRESLFKAVYEYWPNITLELDKDLQYIWKPINYYYYNLNKSTRKACLGFDEHKSNKIILGTNFIHGYDIIFDRANQKLGYVNADCSRGNLLMKSHLGIFKKFNSPIFETNPALVDKEIHKSEKEGKFDLGDDTKNDLVDFIQGHNTELDFGGDFKFVNFIILLISIIIVSVVLIFIIYSLMFNKRGYLKYETSGKNNDDEPYIEDYNKQNKDNKIIFDDK